MLFFFYNIVCILLYEKKSFHYLTIIMVFNSGNALVQTNELHVHIATLIAQIFSGLFSIKTPQFQ